MREGNRARFAVVAVALAALGGLAACGGSSPSAPSTPPPTPPPAPVTTVIGQGSGTGLQPGFVRLGFFTTTRTGDLEIIVDWTFATNDLDIVLAAGENPCASGPNTVNFGTCTLVAFSATTAKPERLRVAALAAGTYTLYVPNNGPGEEAFSFQILLTTQGTAGASAGATTSAVQGQVTMPFLARGDGLSDLGR